MSSNYAKPKQGAPDRNNGGVVPKRLLVARGESPALLQQIERALDFRPRFVLFTVELSGLLAVLLRRNDRSRPLPLELCANFIAVVCLVTKQLLRLNLFNQRRRRLTVVPLAYGYFELYGEPQRIGYEVNLGS